MINKHHIWQIEFFFRHDTHVVKKKGTFEEARKYVEIAGNGGLWIDPFEDKNKLRFVPAHAITAIDIEVIQKLEEIDG